MKKKAINEAVRDICSISVAPAAKSEVRRIVLSLYTLGEQDGRNDAVEYVLKNARNHIAWWHGDAVVYVANLRDMLELARTAQSKTV